MTDSRSLNRLNGVDRSSCPDRLISVGIIFHNQAQYVRRCLDSVINQTYKRIEVICVDDASEDETRDIIREYVEKNDNIRLISLENNMSENIARKKTVEEATGAHMIFVDGDDYLEGNACEILIDEICRQPVDILQFGVNIIKTDKVTEGEVISSMKRCNPMIRVLNGEQVFENCFAKNTYYHIMWNKMYDTALLKKAFYYIEDRKIHYGADIYQYFIISHMALSSRGIDSKLYNYSMDVGISGAKKISLDQYRRVCSIRGAIEGLYVYSEKTGDYRLKSVVDRIQISAVSDCIKKAKERLEGSMDAGIDILKESFPIDIIVSEMSHYLTIGEKNEECHLRMLEEKQNEKERLESEITKEITRRQELEKEIDGVYKDLGRINESCLRLMEDQKQKDEEINSLDREIDEMKEQIGLIHQSKSFKIGRALTLIPRWIRHIVSGYPM